MALYACHYYKRLSGKAPVKEFINSLDPNTQSKFFFKKSLLEQYGIMLPEPHASYLKEGIFELRFRSTGGHIRVLYFFAFKKSIIFTNGFRKKTRKVPRKELALAIQRKEEFLNRHKQTKKRGK